MRSPMGNCTLGGRKRHGSRGAGGRDSCALRFFTPAAKAGLPCNVGSSRKLFTTSLGIVMAMSGMFAIAGVPPVASAGERVPVSGRLILDLVAHAPDGGRKLTRDFSMSGELKIQQWSQQGSDSANASGGGAPKIVMSVNFDGLCDGDHRDADVGAHDDIAGAGLAAAFRDDDRRVDDPDGTGLPLPPRDDDGHAIFAAARVNEYVVDPRRGADILLAGDEDAACKATVVESPSPVAKAEALGGTRAASDTPPASSVHGPIFDVPDSPEQARAAAEDAAPMDVAPDEVSSAKKRRRILNEEVRPTSAPRRSAGPR